MLYNKAVEQDNWRAALEREVEQAGRARADGLEGRARVCARRAAAVAIQEYYRRQAPGGSVPRRSALEWIEVLKDDPNAAQVRGSLELFLIRVRPDFQLPVDVDLIAEIRGLVNHLGLDDV